MLRKDFFFAELQKQITDLTVYNALFAMIG